MIGFYRVLTVVISLIVLAACGGGGSLERDDPTGPTTPPTPSFSVSMAITDAQGNASNQLSNASPLFVTATVTNQDGDAVEDVEVVFTFTQPNLATFDNDTGTGLTDANGEATIGLLVGQNSGSGSVVATLPGGETGQIGFNSSGTSPTEIIPASLDFYASATQLPSSGGDQIELIAVVKNEQNILLEGINVEFSADNGASVQVTQGVTAEDGTARALVSTPNNPEVRTIVATASTVNFQETIEINVVGTEININGPGSIPIGADVEFEVIVVDSDGTGIANVPVQVSSQFGNLTVLNPTTNNSGVITAQYSSSVSGTDTITASALNVTGQDVITVQEDNFAFITPASSDVEVGVGNGDGDGFVVSVNWQKDGANFEGGNVTFTTTRGGFDNDVVSTDADGNATVTITSLDAGTAILSAVGDDGQGNTVTARAELEFVATNASEIRVDASTDLLGPGQDSTISALVRDPTGNLVKGKAVNFNVSDNQGGSLNAPTAVTNSNGVASVVFTAGSASSEDSIVVTATVADTPSVSGTVTLTVGDRAFDISLGTGRQVQIPDASSYLKEFAVFVSDSVGRPVADVELTVSQTPIKFVQGGVYRKGFWLWDPGAEVWVAVTTAVCPNEDINGNGALDPGEDTNGDGQLTPGLIGTITFAGSVNETDENGQATLEYRYPKNLAPWTEREIRVFGQSTSSESTDSLKFTLTVASDDVTEEDSPPPANPYGRGDVCTDTN
ncbi:Ig-like domain-containing protein [Aestuariibacter salexigens]|uniref:Ig-like domain-containing protein n=1 Tax=Aestuariibacter salexigens TaxID=226010 RepID=UPI00041F9299|nr:Ig-like domain-containing protein [Aestuariibacter salexigens]